jgi:pimeloyl-ACP methyl ester carboxylesterase
MSMADPRISPLLLKVPVAAIEDLQDRLSRTRFPDGETVEGEVGKPSWMQGPPREVVEDYVSYWSTDYDWRRVEDDLNAHGQSLTTIDGLDVHFLHVRSPRADATPLIITHGWPSSVIEPLQVMDVLANPASPADPAFHVVPPSLPGFGFGGKPTRTGWGVRRTAAAWVELMDRLGYPRFFAAGGDWGGRVTASLGSDHADRVIGLHTFTPYVSEPDEDAVELTADEAKWVADARTFWHLGSGYSLEQSTRPQTIAYGLADSPVAQLTWILEKLHFWTDRSDAEVTALTRDQILDTVSLYWFSATGGSSARYYWENFPPERSTPVHVPTAISIFPAEFEKLPRPWVERRFRNVQYWNETSRGGHFPMLEVPKIYVDELRSGLGSLTSMVVGPC